MAAAAGRELAALFVQKLAARRGWIQAEQRLDRRQPLPGPLL